MTNGNEMHLTVSATTRCDRGCSHCSFESTPTGIDFTLEQAKRVADLIIDSGAQTIVNITGGGEPLLNQDLPEIVRLISQPLNVIALILITSGFRTREERKILKHVIKSVENKRLRIAVSFHQFSKDHIKRITDSIRFLLQQRNRYVKSFDIKTTVALERKENTLGILNGIFNKFDIYPFIIEPEGTKRFKMDRFEKIAWSEDYAEYLFGLAHFMDCWFWQEDSRKWILVTTQPLEAMGRAKNLPSQQRYFEPYCPAMIRPKKISLKIDVNGGIYPSSCCHPKAYPNLAVATLEDNWPTVLTKRNQFSDKILRLLLADKRMYDHPNHICSLCSRIKKELDANA
jgi:MoaA/NifB/PqqE/SkfB family radical SAM enzyme